MGQATVLFCVGATKAGTGWLYQYLAAHPECHFRSIKELHYFSALANGTVDRELTKHQDRQAVLSKKVASATGHKMVDHMIRLQDRAEWIEVLKNGENTQHYLSYLNGGSNGEKIVGDITPAYALLPELQLRRMAAIAPEVRFLYVLRDPVERIWSHIRMIASRREPSGEVTMERAGRILRRTMRGDESQIATRSDYRGNITRLKRAVGHRLKLVFFEDLFSGQGVEEI